MIPIMLYYPILLRRSRKKHVGRIGPTKQILTSKKAHKWFKVTEEVWTKEGIHDHYLRPYCTVCGTPLHSAPTLLFRLFQMILTVHHYSCYSLLILLFSFHALPCYSYYSLLIIIWFHKFPYYSHRSPLFLTIPFHSIFPLVISIITDCSLYSIWYILFLIIPCYSYYSSFFLLFFTIPINPYYSYYSMLCLLFLTISKWYHYSLLVRSFPIICCTVPCHSHHSRFVLIIVYDTYHALLLSNTIKTE